MDKLTETAGPEIDREGIRLDQPLDPKSPPNPELERFEKAVNDCREFLRKNIGGKGQLTLAIAFEGGRITHVQKNLVEA